MALYDIYNNSDLLQTLVTLEGETSDFFKASERTLQGMETNKIVLHSDLYIKPGFAARIGELFVYFKGLFLGNNHTIYVFSEESISLFSSTYYATIKDLTIHSENNSYSMLIADDINHSIINNVKLEGSVTARESSGGFAKTSQNSVFKNCIVDINIKSRRASLERENTDPIHFGGYIGVALDGTQFENCVASGSMKGEVCVGGFCAIGKGVEFLDCSLENLSISAKREVGGFVGRTNKPVSLISIDVENVKITGSFYIGFIIGLSKDRVVVHGLTLTNSNILPDSTSSYVGGIVGSTRSLDVFNTVLQGGIIANFIIAGACPDSQITNIEASHFDLDITALGYPPMVTHAYKIVRDKYLTSSNFNISNKLKDTTSDGVLKIVSDGNINPFKEDIL